MRAAYSESGKPVTAQDAAVDASVRPETFGSCNAKQLRLRHKFFLPAGNFLVKLASGTDGIGIVNTKLTVPDLPIQKLYSRVNLKRADLQRDDLSRGRH